MSPKVFLLLAMAFVSGCSHRTNVQVSRATAVPVVYDTQDTMMDPEVEDMLEEWPSCQVGRP